MHQIPEFLVVLQVILIIKDPNIIQTILQLLDNLHLFVANTL